jgi:hypothetical protein
VARLIFRALGLVLLLCGSTAALAEPVTAAIGVWFAAASAATIAVTALYIASTAYSIYGAIQAKKKARAAAQRAAEREAANLKDRTTTVLASDAPWPVIYGQPAPVGGSIVALFTSGADDRFKHIVYVLASHECDGVAAIYIGGDSVGALSPSGYASSPAFALEGGVPQTETRTFELESKPIADPLGNGDGSPAMSEEGYWYFPFGFDADGFELVELKHTDGSPYDGSVRVGMAPNTEGGRSLIGPIGATGSVTYIVNGAGSAVNVQIHLSPGGVDTADAFLRGARPDLWTVDHKLSGCTYLVVTLNLLLDRFQGGIPEITAQLRGKKVYDYRTGQTAYSRNPALCLADFIRSEAGYGADASQIDVDAVVAAANACQVGVYDFATVEADPATYGFLQARYTCDGMFRTDQDRDATRQQIEDAMCGASLESGGVWRILAGAWTTPVLSLTDDDMVMPISIVQTCNVGTARYNGMKGTYVNATRLGVTEDFTPYQNPVFRAQDVKDKYLDTALSFTGNHIRTQQIARVLVEQSRGGFVVQVHPKMFAWNLQPGDRIVLSSLLFGFTNKTFRVQDWTYQAGTPVALQCVEDEESFYDQVDETRADAAPNTALPSPFLRPAAPLDLVVASGEANMAQQDGVMVVRAKVSWRQSDEPMVLLSGTVRVQWRRGVDASAWQTADLPGDATETYLLGLEVHQVYVVRVQFLTAYSAGPWAVAQHALQGVEGFPDAVVGLTLTVERTGVFAKWQEPDGIDLLGWSATQLRRGPTWELGESFVLFDGHASSANLGWLPAGEQKIWAAHHSTIGRWSEAVSATITIAVPAQPLVTGVSALDGVDLAWQDCRTTQPLSAYRVSTGPTQAGAALRGSTLATAYHQRETIIATRRYWVVAVDAGGNVSAGGYIELASGGDINSTIVAATSELKNGLDTVTAQITNPATGLAAVKLLAEAASQGQAIQYLEQADDLNTLAQTTLRSLLQGNDGQLALAAARSEIYTRVASGLSAESAQRLQLALIVGRQQGSLTQIAQVMSDQYGNLSARWGVTLDVNGRITGVELLGTGQQTTAVWLVDKFGIGLPGANGQTVYPFIVGTVNGQPSVAVNGNLFVDGSVIARHLAASVITADKIAAGAITADKMAVNSITAQNAALGDASVDTLKVAGQAITVPAYVAGPTNDLYLNYNISGTGSFQVYIHCSMTMAFTGSFEIYIDGQMRYAGAAIGGTLAGVGFSPVLSAGSHVIRLYSDKTTNANNSSIYALATKR